MIHKYPFIKQSGYKDCAVACLYMIIRYYNGFVSMSRLEEMLKVTKNGTTAYHIVSTLERLGFIAYGLRDKKLKPTKIPFIAHTIIESSYKHYMVVYEVTSKYVRVADPASGIKKMNYDEFLRIWTGVSIQMYPNEVITFEKSKTRVKLFKLNKKIVFIIGFISIVITILSICFSFFFQFLIERNDLKHIVSVFVFVVLVKVILSYIREKILIKFTSNIEKDVMQRVFKNVIKLPYRYYHNHTTGEMTSKINDLIVFKDITLKLIFTFFIDLPLTVFSGFVLFYLSKKLFIISLFILMFYVLIMIVYHKKMNINIYSVLEEKSKLNSFMTESIYGFESIKGIDAEDRIINIFSNKYDGYVNSKMSLAGVINRQNVLKDMVGSYGLMLILVVGILLVKKGVMSLGVFITYNLLLSFFLEPFKNIINLDYEIKEARNALDRIFCLIDIDERNKIISSGNIEICNLSFSFDDIHYVLKGINIKIKEGNKVLITGNSGSGKSTLLKIIKGYYNDFDGELLIGGKKDSFLENVVYISNMGTLFTGTINYNLKLKGNDELEQRIKMCVVDEIINRYPLRGNTLLEEDGFNISAGQKQRLILARSLHNFSVLLIDEGLNAVDVNLERRILKNLFQKYKNKTIIIVSHRLDNLDLFDEYIKLDNGQVVFSSIKSGKEV
ncbi:MAG: peptidase domain-containing ABC transporter [Bacilli bacterium]|nr:peptidase domain-containing ABC transporter [Bacilli bacterium]